MGDSISPMRSSMNSIVVDQSYRAVSRHMDCESREHERLTTFMCWSDRFQADVHKQLAKPGHVTIWSHRTSKLIRVLS